MAHHLQYTILLLFTFTANLLFCQQDSIDIQYTDDCGDQLSLSGNSLTKATLIQQLFEKGYPYAIVDSVAKSDAPKSNFLVDCGPHINEVSIQWSGADVFASVKNRLKIIPWEEILIRREKLLTSMANKGYPYTRLLTHAVGISHDTLILDYALDTIRRIYIQDVEIDGKFSMNPALFAAMTGVSEGQLFNLDRIDHSREIIRRWDFADLKKLEYDFNPYSVNLKYYIEPSHPSRFDMLIGLVPSNRPHKKYEITGNAFLDVRNQLKMAERIYLKFDKYANSSQSIDLRFDFPYLPVLRSGILAEGLIDRRDSTVLDVHGRLGLQYSWKQSVKYAFFLQRDQSRLISINSRRLMARGELPEELDYNYSAAGLNLTYQKLDHVINPRKGLMFSGTITGGLKKLVRNGQILASELPDDKTSFQLQYDSLTQSTVKSALDVSLDSYIPIGDYSTFRWRTMAGWTWSSVALYDNEERRLGGFRNFRGFPEKSLTGDAFAAMTAEYRFLFGAESNAYLFSDFGFIHQPGQKVLWNFPYSVGIGLNLGTKAGIFGISYSVGGQRKQPLSLDQSRVNFGLVVNY